MGQKDHKVFKSFTMIIQIGISMMVPIFLCAAIGWQIDRHFHTELWFLIMIFLGIGAAFRNVYMLTKSFYASDMKKEHDRIKYIQDLKNYSSGHPDEDFGDVFEGKKKRYPENKGETRH